MTSAHDWILGVDGGGTKTVAWLAEATGPSGADPRSVRPMAQGTAGASNPQSVGWDTALANLDAAIDAAIDSVRSTATPGGKSGPVAAAVLALAGSDRDENRQRLLDWAQRRGLAQRLALAHDGQAVLAAGSPDYCGVALIAGTGSLAFGRDRSGRTARAGGWGFLLSDEGSGYAIAVAGLRAAAQAFDGHGDETRLGEHFAQALGADGFEQLVLRVYERADDRAAIAALAPVVWNAATAGDAVAWRLLTHAARQWLDMIRSVADKLRMAGKPFPLALSGGVLVGNRVTCGLLADAIEKHDLSCTSITVVDAPVAGAVQLAQQLLKRPPGVHTL
jgi:N-acetylglucosamine kinase-like BadF-type ATPase